jgi:hypothetical protein
MKLRQKSTEDYLLALEKQTEEEGEAMRKEYEDEKKHLEDMKKLQTESTVAYLLAQEKELEERGEMMRKEYEDEKKFSIERIKLESDIYKDIRGYEKEYYEAQKQLIADRMKALRAAGVSEVAIDAWTKEERRKLTDKQILKEQDFFSGMKVGLEEMQRNMMTFGRAGYEIFNQFATSSRDALSTILFDSIKKGTLDIKAIWEGFTNSMLKKFTDILAQMIVEAATKEIVMFFKSTWTSGGADVLGIVNKVLGLGINLGGITGGSSASVVAGGAPAGSIIPYAYGGLIPGYASGGDSYANDTILARLSPGEYVVPRSQVGAIASKGRMGDTILAHINPTEAALLKSIGGSGTVNPYTGLPEFGFFSSIGKIFKSVAKIATFGLLDLLPAEYRGLPTQEAKSMMLTMAMGFLGGPLGWVSAMTQLVLNAALGETRDQMKLSYESASDQGLLISLASMMSGIAPQSNRFRFALSARNGIEYVPYDNFRINAHRGEAVLDKSNAERWRRGEGVTINSPLVHIEGNLIANKQDFDEFVEKIEYALDKRARRVYS